MSKQVVFKSFAELALALRLEELTNEAQDPGAPTEVTSDKQDSTVDIDHLLAELEAACADLHHAAQQDETARAAALRDLECYDALVARLRQAEAAQERATQVRSEAEALVAAAFTPEARMAASRVVEAAKQARISATCIAQQYQSEVDQLASRLDLERLLAERRRQEELERAREVMTEAKQALEGGRVQVARDILIRAAEEGIDSPDLAAIGAQVKQRLLAARTIAAEQALWTARRTYRHNPSAAVAALELLVVDDLPEPLVRQVFGAWARACLRLCRERGIEAPLRYAPNLGRGAILAPDDVEGAFVVVSALGMGAEWPVGRRVGEDVARKARPLV